MDAKRNIITWLGHRRGEMNGRLTALSRLGPGAITHAQDDIYWK